MGEKTDRQTDRQTDRHIDRQTDRKARDEGDHWPEKCVNRIGRKDVNVAAKAEAVKGAEAKLYAFNDNHKRI